MYLLEILESLCSLTQIQVYFTERKQSTNLNFVISFFLDEFGAKFNNFVEILYGIIHIIIKLGVFCTPEKTIDHKWTQYFVSFFLLFWSKTWCVFEIIAYLLCEAEIFKYVFGQLFHFCVFTSYRWNWRSLSWSSNNRCWLRWWVNYILNLWLWIIFFLLLLIVLLRLGFFFLFSDVFHVVWFIR